MDNGNDEQRMREALRELLLKNVGDRIREHADEDEANSQHAASIVCDRVTVPEIRQSSGRALIAAC
jgi:hypothetical protein